MACQETFDMIPPPDPIDPTVKTIYMVGGATPNGWDIDNATPITSITGNPDQFEWTGVLVVGELKFTLDKQSDWEGAWYLATEEGAIANGEEQAVRYSPSGDGGADYKWSIPYEGEYTIELDAEKLRIKITPNFEPEPEPQPDFDKLYFVGSFNDWGFEPLMQDKTNPMQFKLGREMIWKADGEFKFGTESENYDNMFHPSIANAPFTHSEIVFKSVADNKWKMAEEECGRAYKMVVDISENGGKFTMKEFTPFPTIYLVGEATPNGWDINSATALESVEDNPYVFTWAGELKPGELKFTCDKQDDWQGAWFLAWKDGLEPDGEEQQLVFSPNGDDGNDRKFKITEAGTYTIIFDQLKEIVIISK